MNISTAILKMHWQTIRNYGRWNSKRQRLKPITLRHEAILNYFWEFWVIFESSQIPVTDLNFTALKKVRSKMHPPLFIIFRPWDAEWVQWVLTPFVYFSWLPVVPLRSVVVLQRELRRRRPDQDQVRPHPGRQWGKALPRGLEREKNLQPPILLTWVNRQNIHSSTLIMSIENFFLQSHSLK